MISRLVTDLEEPKANWVDLLPKAVRLLQDLPDPHSGVTPYEYVHGRRRNLGGVPYKPTLQAPDASRWLKEQEKVHERMAERVKVARQKRAEQVNKGRREPKALKVGDVAWYHPEPKPGRDKLEPMWLGPGRVTKREGEQSYVVEIAPGREQRAHRSQLRLHEDDVYAGKPFPLHYFAGKAPEVEPVLKENEYIVEEDGVLAHRFNGEGLLEFKVKWRDYEEPTWQPAKDLQNDALTSYMNRKGLMWTLEKGKSSGKKTAK